MLKNMLPKDTDRALSSCASWVEASLWFLDTPFRQSNVFL